MRMWVWRMTPSSHSISRCLPWLSTRSIVLPARGTIPTSRGASKRTIFLSTGAVRLAAAARWMVSPPGIGLPGYAWARRAGWTPDLRQGADVGQGHPDEPVDTTRHLVPHPFADGFVRREPRQVERFLGRLAV